MPLCLDFNLSKILRDVTQSSSSSTGGGVNNPMWLAPEIIKGRHATAASDVYSFALCMLEVSGHPSQVPGRRLAGRSVLHTS